MTDQTPTPEQIAAWNRIASRFDSRQFDTDLALIEPFVSEALTNQQAVLPTDPGRYIDRFGNDDWLLDGGAWFHGESMQIPGEMAPFAPFTRLVPERPPITREQLIELMSDLNDSWPTTADKVLALVNGTDR